MSNVTSTSDVPDLSDVPPVAKPPVAARSWRKAHALGLPEGSIRALLAVAIFATIWVLLAYHPQEEVPDYLRDLLFIVMGHYFASRKRADSAPTPGPGPLFLPRGTIRVIIFCGFGLVAYLLFRRGRLLDPLHNPGVVTLMLAGGFLLGVMLAKVGDWWRGRGHQVPRWVEDAKAVTAMLAAVALIVMVWNRYDPVLIPRFPDAVGGLSLRFGKYGPEHIVGAIVGFYFGSRS